MTTKINPFLAWEQEFAEEIAAQGLTRPGYESKEWDESQHPRVPAGSSEGGQWTEDGGPGDLGISDTPGSPAKPAITDGVDLRGNAERLLSGIKLTPEQEVERRALEADLRDAPFIHAADDDAVKAILSSNAMLSNEALEADTRKLRNEWSDIMYEEVGDLLDSKDPDDRVAGERFLAKLDDLSTQKEMSWVLAHKLTEQVCLQRYGEPGSTPPIADSIIHKLGDRPAGNTNEQDVTLGLNRYVFGALYEPNEGYGDSYVIVNRNQMGRQGSFVSKNDIANIGYDVAQYKQEIIDPADWAHTAAVMAASDSKYLPGNWEAKIPNSVPKSAILGVITKTDKVAESLKGLGVPVRWLPTHGDYAFPSHREWLEAFRSDALYLQRNGTFPS